MAERYSPRTDRRSIAMCRYGMRDTPMAERFSPRTDRCGIAMCRYGMGEYPHG